MVKSFSSYFFALSISTGCMQAMEQQKQLLDLRNGASWTPLHTAVSVGNIEAVKQLLDCGARIDSRALPSQRTPLMFSADYNKNAIAELLLKKGAPVDQTDNEHTSALHISCKKGNVDVVETLVLAGASLALVDGSGNNPLSYALAYKDFTDSSVFVAIQKALKKKHDAESAAQGFALHRACQADSVEDIQKLLREGARINELDKNGNSAIHYAAANTNPEILKALLATVNKKEDNARPEVSIPSESLVSKGGFSPAP